MPVRKSTVSIAAVVFKKLYLAYQPLERQKNNKKGTSADALAQISLQALQKMTSVFHEIGE